MKEEPRSKENKDHKRENIFGEYNNYCILTLRPGKNSDLNDIESAEGRFLDATTAQLSDEISGDSIRAVQ